MTLRDAWLRVRALFAPRRAERELHDELAFHIERETQKHVARGMSPAAARARTMARFGSVALTADQCRDARGTSAIDALARDVAYAWRTFQRAPLAAATIVGTVALGLGLITIVFTLFNFGFLRVDAVRNPHELYSVQEPDGSDRVSRPLTRADYDAIRTETSAFADVAAILRPVRTRIDGRVVSGALVTGNFFEMVGVDAALGRTLTRDDDRMIGRPTVVLSHRSWRKIFDGDPHVIGRTVRINGVQFEVAGVLPEDFRGLALGPPDYWAPLALAGQLRDGYEKPEAIAVDVVGRLAPGTSREAAAAALSVWASRRADRPHVPGRPTVITLRPRSGALSESLLGIVAVATPLFFAFGLVLMIGCANVANLLLARGVSRQRELGIRLALGASRRRVIRQLLTENLLLALIAAACALGVSRLFLELAVYAVTQSMPPELAEQLHVGVPTADWRVPVFAVAGAVVATMLFGLVPALQATRLELVRTMRGDVTKTARPGRARHALIAVQVGASALLLICAGVFLRSAAASARFDPGVRTADTVKVYIAKESRRAAMLQSIAVHPLVTAVSAASQPARAFASTAIADQPGHTPETSRRVAVQQIVASPEYFGVLGLDMMAGRWFTSVERGVDASIAVVSETAARELWPNRSALGQVIRVQLSLSDATESTEPVRTFTVVGVVRDVKGPLAPDFFPSRGVYVPGSIESPRTSLTLRVRGDPEQARQALVEHLTSIEPGLGEVSTMRTIAGVGTYILQIAFWVAVVLGGLALMLTLSGLFSVLSYVVAQQTKEIGLRVALGATTKSVAGFVIGQAFRSVTIGLAAGSGLAAAVATLLLSTPAAGEIGAVVHVLDPVAYITGVLVIASACLLAASLPTLRAARIDPIAAIRNE
ncbi:MAG TPA: ABC transporter permease [Vicinamibacterales bacterium]|nr:ABC transporter permease [Vicinamibacterales bacterium]